MAKEKWEFPYAANILCDAAKAKAEFHQSRVDWWAAKKKETMDKIKAEGIEIDDSLADGGTMSMNYARGPAVSVRMDLQRDLSECVGKVKEHENKTKDYQGWIEVLASQGQTMFPLTQSDWLFFFSKR